MFLIERDEGVVVRELVGPSSNTMIPMLLVLWVAATLGTADCPVNGSIVVSAHAVGCVGLQLTIAADNITIVIEGATGRISVTSVAAGTTFRVLGSLARGVTQP